MEAKSTELVAVLKNSNLSVDVKVSQLLGLKSDIKQKNVPERAVPQIFECCRLSIGAPHLALITAGFSTLGHFLKRLFLQGEDNLILRHVEKLLTLLLQRLGDHRDRVRAQSAQALTDMWPAARPEVEHATFELGLRSRNPRTKQSSLVMLATMVVQNDLAFRQYVPDLMECLEDADRDVRECAKVTIVELFQYAPSHAKTDLKFRLAEGNVRSSIVNEIYEKVGLEPDLSISRPSSVRPPSVRPPSRGDVMRRPPSRGDVLHRPPSRGNVLQRPQSRIDTSHAHPESNIPHSASVAAGSAPVDDNTALVSYHRTNANAYVAAPAAADDNVAVISHNRNYMNAHVTGPTPVDDNATLVPYHRTNANAYVAVPAAADDNATTTTERSYTPQIIPESVDDHIAPVSNHPISAVAGISSAVSNSASVVSRPHSVASSNTEQIVEDPVEHAPVVVRPVPTRPTTTRVNVDKAPPMANASVDRRVAPTTPRHTHHDIDDTIEPRDLTSAREFEQIVREMLPCFEGKEDETNWQKREKSIIMLRRITHGNTPHDFTQAYLAGMKTMLDPIFKVANSLRTTMQTTGLRMLQSFARINQTALDPMIDIILSNAMKLCGNSKKITSQNGNLTVATLLENVTCNTRVLGHITSAATNTNNNLRLFSAGWLRIIINGQTRHKTTPDGLATIAQCIKNGVSDARGDNREAYRFTYWDFHKMFPDRARQILSEVLPKHRSMIEKDAANPMNDPFVSSSTSSSTGLFGSTPGRPTARGAISTKGNASLAASKNLPSTMAVQSAQLDTTRTTRPRKKLRSAAPGTPPSSLSSAPMRPGASKPRTIKPTSTRPATAAGFHPDRIESAPGGSPTRNPVAQPSTPSDIINFSRPRQKSDPLQDVSPTKMAHRSIDDHIINPDQPFGPISIPTKRGNTSEGETSERKNAENTAPHKVLTNVPQVRPRVGSISEAIESATWPNVNVKEALDNDEKVRDFSSGPSLPKRLSSAELASKIPEYLDERRPSDGLNSPGLSKNDAEEIPSSEAVKVEKVSPANTMTKTPVSPKPSIEFDKGETNEDESSRRNSTVDEPRRVSVTLPKWPEVDHKPILQPDGMPPFQIDDEMSDMQDEDDLGMRSDDGSPDSKVRAARALRPPSDLPPSQATPLRREVSLRSQDPVQAREMLAKGIERIRTRDMDMNGYRKLQGLIEFHDTLFTDKQQFDYMLMALLEELKRQTPPSEKALRFGSVWDFKTQVLYTVRYMFVHAKNYFSDYYPVAVVRLLEAQELYGIVRHLIKLIDQLIDDIVDVSEPSLIINALLVHLDQPDLDDGYRILRKGFETMGHALSIMNEKNTKLPDSTLDRIGELATEALRIQSMGVKRRVIALCVELRVMVADEERYWQILGGAERGVQGLLFYYKSKHRAL
ncbi:clasp N terminal-domain-containing protein [Aspergillus aurantiobrunneus]